MKMLTKMKKQVEQIATLYYHCSESIEDDIDCPEYEEENLSGKKTLKINYDTSTWSW